MKFRLVPNWKRVLKHAWSFQLNVLIALATAIDAGITYWIDGRLSASLFVGGTSLAASILRLIKQESVSGATDGE